MELILKRYFWTIPVVVILVCGLLAAKATNQVLEAKFLLGQTKKPSARKLPTKPVATKPPPSKDAEGIVARNMFCSTCDPPKPVEPVGGGGPVAQDGRPPNTTLSLTLV